MVYPYVYSKFENILEIVYINEVNYLILDYLYIYYNSLTIWLCLFPLYFLNILKSTINLHEHNQSYHKCNVFWDILFHVETDQDTFWKYH